MAVLTDVENPLLSSKFLRKVMFTLNKYGVKQFTDLTQIAVVGDSSCNKSSVLSAITTTQFPEITTKCPIQLILSCSNTFSGKAMLKRYSNGECEGVTVIHNIGQIAELISKFSQQIMEEGENISEDIIVIEAFGPEFPNLTLIDLPVIRTMSDAEDKNMRPQVMSLANRYFQQPRTLILAVVPENVDVHNCDILQVAAEADPEGDRTLGLVTTAELVDQGAESFVVKLLLFRRKCYVFLQANIRLTCQQSN